jgi:16S rRNA (cytidine1402-2'-O)-methyltransferase
MAGKLYIVATPIGNLEDITLRAVRVLKEVHLIAAEDTRVTRKLLNHFDIHTPATPYHQHSKGRKSEQIAEIILGGHDVALVSDAGTPGISDPGHELIAYAVERGITIVFVPGANAMTMALVVSGLPTTHFAFDGFPPRKTGERAEFFRGLRREKRTLVFYESPLRLLTTLKTAMDELGDRRCAVLREATKLYEEIFRGALSDAIVRFTSPKPRGEVTLVVEGASEDAGDDDRVVVAPEDRLRELIGQGTTERDAVRQVAAELSIPHRDTYAAMLRVKSESPAE